jgi:hypothetical protein
MQNVNTNLLHRLKRCVYVTVGSTSHFGTQLAMRQDPAVYYLDSRCTFRQENLCYIFYVDD